MQLAMMIEGQNGLNWTRWGHLAAAAEDLGFVGLYRSDHFTNANPPDIDSLELWVSLAWLAAHTHRIEFGPLVTPCSFRAPAFTARMAKDVDDLSGGRLQLGLGAGWQVREHHAFGFDLLDVRARMDRFEESLDVITQLLHSDDPVSYSGKYYQLHEATLRPRPHRPGGPPIVIGGNGPVRTLPLVARYADEWNAVYQPPAGLVQLNAKLDELAEANGREPSAIRRSMMIGTVFGRDDAEVKRKLGNRDRHTLRERGSLVGTPNEWVDQLGKIAETGVYRVMLQWLDLDDLDGLEAVAKMVLPQV